MFVLRGKITNIFHPKAGQVSSNGFYIFTLGDVTVLEGDYDKLSFTKYGTLSVQGTLSECKLDQYIDLKIEFLKSDPRFGTSYKIVEEVINFELNSEEDLKAFIYSLNLTDRQANNLLECEDSIEYIKTGNIEELTKIRGIGEFTAKKIIEKFESNKELQKYYQELYKLGFDNYNHRVKIVRHYLNKIESFLRAKNRGKDPDKEDIEKAMKSKILEIKKNPYMLMEIDGFGLKTVDEIATVYLKIPYDSEFRIEKFAEFILESHGNSGRSYLPFGDFFNFLKKEVEEVKEGRITVKKTIDKDVFVKVLLKMQKEEKVILNEDGSKIALKYFYDLELNVSKELMRIHKNVSDRFDVKDRELIIKDVEMEQGFGFSDEQKSAIDIMIEPTNGVTVLTGFAGVGKTTVVGAVHRVFEGYRIGQFCFAGKAAQRMSEVSGKEASTIHMHLSKLKKAEEDDKPEYDIYVVDEASMIHLELILSLLKTIPNGAKLFILGDVGQLQSLTTGNLLTDIINSNTLPVAKLTKVYRQGMESGILSTSVDVRNQKQLCKYKEDKDVILGTKQDLRLITRAENIGLEDLVVKTYGNYYEESENVLDIQILSPLKEKGSLAANNLNITIQNYLLPYLSETFYECNKLKFHIGDKVINTKNNYGAKTEDDEKVAVFNGSIGLVVDFVKDAGIITGLIIDFIGIGRVVYVKEDCAKLNLAYAITVHSSQGSEFKNIIYVLPMQAYSLLNKENVYTAITRGKKHCTIVAESSALHKAISTSEINSKMTFLQSMLCSQ